MRYGLRTTALEISATKSLLYKSSNGYTFPLDIYQASWYNIVDMRLLLALLAIFLLSAVTALADTPVHKSPPAQVTGNASCINTNCTNSVQTSQGGTTQIVANPNTTCNPPQCVTVTTFPSNITITHTAQLPTQSSQPTTTLAPTVIPTAVPTVPVYHPVYHYVAQPTITTAPTPLPTKAPVHTVTHKTITHQSSSVDTPFSAFLKALLHVFSFGRL